MATRSTITGKKVLLASAVAGLLALNAMGTVRWPPKVKAAEAR